jgi:CheY-like chemotaxis protein
MATASPAPATPTRRRVLVVDDNADMADIVVNLLSAVGYDARAAYGGRQAVTTVSQLDPFAVVMDIDMPGVDGHQAAKEIRRIAPGIKLLALTGGSSDADRAAAHAAGFDAFLVKSFAAGDIVQALDDLGR